jgi:hypothetical protein
MMPDKYIARVIDTFNTWGHRQNPQFVGALALAESLANRKPEVVTRCATEVRELIREGLAEYVPGSSMFEAQAAVEYAALTANTCD